MRVQCDLRVQICQFELHQPLQTQKEGNMQIKSSSEDSIVMKRHVRRWIGHDRRHSMLMQPTFIYAARSMRDNLVKGSYIIIRIILFQISFNVCASKCTYVKLHS